MAFWHLCLHIICNCVPFFNACSLGNIFQLVTQDSISREFIGLGCPLTPFFFSMMKIGILIRFPKWE
ncbi:unnamed protein product, partial [Vitis vinifera]|uniref:Uncharacterized protein n=1 Tax=Vitis vinifera TaxID=29760 RepID=D7TU33_VITVI